MSHYSEKRYIKAKRAVLKDLLDAGWGFAIAEWTRVDGEQLRANGESFDDTGKRLPAYDYWSEDYSTYDCGVHLDLMAIAKKHDCYWENINAAETGLVGGW